MKNSVTWSLLLYGKVQSYFSQIWNEQRDIKAGPALSKANFREALALSVLSGVTDGMVILV